MQRRDFIRLSSALTGINLLAQACKAKPHPIPGEIIGASAAIGHMLRDHTTFGEPTEIITKKVVIVGGGISGLSAARWLKKNSIDDLVVLDLEHRVGGNAASGQNEVSSYPWGAHYIPVPNNDLPEYHDFLTEAGVITGHNEKGLPVYNDYYLCYDPQERLYINGTWQDGLIPRHGVTGPDAAEIKRFLQQMDQFRTATGNDGLQAFSIPVDRSSKDPEYTKLDELTMLQWLQQNNYHSSYLHWYVNYCTRDDFGTRYGEISAWTGIHYFAGRKGQGANASHYDVLTWPEGNGWLVKQLCQALQPDLQPDALVTKIIPQKGYTFVHYFDTQTKQLKAIKAEQVILATPQFVNSRILPSNEERAANMHYTPWMVANLTVTDPEERSGQPLSWDNVLYESPSLGYVEATHQQLGQLKKKKVFTYYLPLTAKDPVTERKLAYQRTHADWTKLIIDDLKKVHPDIETKTERIDIMIWGHAMCQPLPGWIHGPARRSLQRSLPENIHFAHTDLAGISIFEEGFYQGINAAKKILNS